MIGLVKFHCGCIGWPIFTNVDQYTSALILHSCDGNGEYSLTVRPMDESYAPLDDESTEQYVAELRRLIQDGYKFREIQRLLEKTPT